MWQSATDLNEYDGVGKRVFSTPEKMELAAHFAALVALSATPVAISGTPMAQEMRQDASLAGQLVVWTTVVSSLPIFFASFLLSLGGVFGV